MKLTESESTLLRFADESRIWRVVSGRSRRTSFTSPKGVTRADILKAKKLGWLADEPRSGSVAEWYRQVLTDIGRSALQDGDALANPPHREER